MSVTLRRCWALAVAVVVTLILAATPQPAHAGTKSTDPQADRERLRSERAAVVADVDALHATNEEIAKALEALHANVLDQRALLDDAVRAADQGRSDARRARVEEQRAGDKVASLEERVRHVAVESFMRPVIDDPAVVLTAASATHAAQRTAFLQFWSSNEDELRDELRARWQDVTAWRQAADRTALRAERERAEVASRVDKLEQAIAEQQRFAASVEQRLDAKLAEAASLAAVDRHLADQIASEQAGLAAQLQGTEVATTSVSRVAPMPAVLSLLPGDDPIVSVISVRGIRVHTQMATQLEGLLSAADAEGIELSGGGYRDASAQIALRRAHCGGTEEAVYSMPPSQCSPPTARPGASLHERGLAVDFTYNGALITSRSSPGFQWLAVNAARFGLYNLPSEPWHWSVNGN